MNSNKSSRPLNLLPGRWILLNHLAEVIERLKQKGIFHLEALRKLLQNKKQYPELAETLSVSVDYLVVLNREINGYVSKPVPLSELDVFSDTELEKLQKAGIKSTKDFYEQCLSKTARQELSARLSLPAEQIILALELSDLLRMKRGRPGLCQDIERDGDKRRLRLRMQRIRLKSWGNIKGSMKENNTQKSNWV